LKALRVGMPAEAARRNISEFAAWAGASRLNAGRSISEHMGDPDARAA